MASLLNPFLITVFTLQAGADELLNSFYLRFSLNLGPDITPFCVNTGAKGCVGIIPSIVEAAGTALNDDDTFSILVPDTQHSGALDTSVLATGSVVVFGMTTGTGVDYLTFSLLVDVIEFAEGYDLTNVTRVAKLVIDTAADDLTLLDRFTDEMSEYDVENGEIGYHERFRLGQTSAYLGESQFGKLAPISTATGDPTARPTDRVTLQPTEKTTHAPTAFPTNGSTSAPFSNPPISTVKESTDTSIKKADKITSIVEGGVQGAGAKLAKNLSVVTIVGVVLYFAGFFIKKTRSMWLAVTDRCLPKDEKRESVTDSSDTEEGIKSSTRSIVFPPNHPFSTLPPTFTNGTDKKMGMANSGSKVVVSNTSKKISFASNHPFTTTSSTLTKDFRVEGLSRKASKSSVSDGLLSELSTISEN